MSFPAPQYPGYPQGPAVPQYGAPQQQYQQAPAAPQVQQSADEFWGSATQFSGPVVPSFDFGAPGATVQGTVVRQQSRQRTEMPRPGQRVGDPKFNKDGSPQMQLEITLQTELRGWQGVKPDKIPTGPAGPQGQPGQPLPASEDTGLRRIYAWYTLRDAILEATGNKPVRDGDFLGVFWGGETQPNPMGGSPIKVYKAKHVPAQATDAAWGQQAPAQAPAAPQGFQPQVGYPQQGPVQPTQWQPPQGVPPQYAQDPGVQQVQNPAFAQGQPVTQYQGEPPF